MMRTFLFFSLILILVWALPAFAGGEITVRPLLDCLPMGTGASSGTYYPLGAAFANVLNLSLRQAQIIALPTRGSLDNIRLLLDGELRLAIVQSDVFHRAVRGEEEFRGQEGIKLRALASLYPEAFQALVPADSPVQSLADLRGRRVILGEKGSGSLKTGLAILAQFGIAESDLTPGYLSFDAAIGGLSRGEWDAALLVAGLPTRAVREMAERLPVRLLPLAEEKADELCGRLGYFSPVIIPAGTYPGQAEDIRTVALRALLVGHQDLPDTLVDALLSTLLDRREYLISMHPRAADLDRARLADAVADGFLHPGTRRVMVREKP